MADNDMIVFRNLFLKELEEIEDIKSELAEKGDEEKTFMGRP